METNIGANKNNNNKKNDWYRKIYIAIKGWLIRTILSIIGIFITVLIAIFMTRIITSFLDKNRFSEISNFDLDFHNGQKMKEPESLEKILIEEMIIEKEAAFILSQQIKEKLFENKFEKIWKKETDSRKSIGAILLSGPTGTGKSLIAKRISKKFSSRYTTIDRSLIAGTLVDEGLKKIKKIFSNIEKEIEEIKKLDKKEKIYPIYLILEEVDTLLVSKKEAERNLRMGAKRIVDAFNLFIDKMGESNSEYLKIISTTNYDENIDPASKRRIGGDEVIKIEKWKINKENMSNFIFSFIKNETKIELMGEDEQKFDRKTWEKTNEKYTNESIEKKTDLSISELRKLMESTIENLVKNLVIKNKEEKVSIKQNELLDNFYRKMEDKIIRENRKNEERNRKQNESINFLFMNKNETIDKENNNDDGIRIQ